MKAEDLSGTPLPAPDASLGASRDTSSASTGNRPESSRHSRLSRETLRREACLGDSLLLSSTPPSPSKLGDDTKIDDFELPATDALLRAHSRESTVGPADIPRNNEDASTPADDDDDVWEDEEDSILMDEHGNLVYEGPAYEDSASDFSDDADAEELKLHRRAYREATQQYRKSRRALLLSGLSSFASSPSSEDLDTISPIERDHASASPPASLYDTERDTHPHDSYYQPHHAERIDSINARERANGLRYDLDSGNEVKDNASPNANSNGTHSSNSVTVKQEPPDSFEKSQTFAVGKEAWSTQKCSITDQKAPNGQTLRSQTDATAADKLVRPLLSPRAKSSPLSDTALFTPSPALCQCAQSL